MHKKIIGKVQKIVKELNLPMRQSYTFVLKEIYRAQRFRNHPKNRKKAIRADKRLRTIAGRLVRELERNLGENRQYDELLSTFKKILLQRRNSSHKIYSIHEPDVQCVSKGKEHKKYEFGNKVSIICSTTGVILGASSFRNEYDGHTIEKSLEQVRRLTGKSIIQRNTHGKKCFAELCFLRDDKIVHPLSHIPKSAFPGKDTVGYEAQCTVCNLSIKPSSLKAKASQIKIVFAFLFDLLQYSNAFGKVQKPE